jgi:hypothetical protein
MKEFSEDLKAAETIPANELGSINSNSKAHQSSIRRKAA